MEGIVKIKFGLQANPIVGHNIYVARPDIYSTVALDAIIAYAAKAAGISQSDMLVTLDAMYDAFTYFLCNGHSFKLDGIGTFSLSVKTKASDATLENVIEGADAVESTGINFLPAPELKRILDNISVETYAENENHLAEDESIFGRSIVIGGRSLNLISFDRLKAAAAGVGSDLVIYGYNFEEGMTAVVTGKLEGAAVTETIGLTLLSKKTQNTLKGKFGKAYDIVEKIELKKGSTTVATFDWTGAPIPQNVMAYIGDMAVSEGGVYAAGNSRLMVRGNVENVIVKLDGAILSPLSTSGNVAVYAESIAVGSHTLNVGSQTFAISVTTAPLANITSLSANGVTVASGGSSPVVANASYNFVANGRNTQLVKQSDIQVPAGAVISNFAATTSRVTFTLKMGTQGGTIKVANYTCNLVMQAREDQPTITSCSQVAAGGTRSMEITSTYSFDFTGSNLSNQMTAAFVPASLGEAREITSTSANNLKVRAYVNQTGSGTFCVYDQDGATVWSCKVNCIPSSVTEG